MKAKNILMTLLLVTGAIAAKAAGYPPELALVSQPVMVYNHNSITVYYDVENIGDYTYRGDICIFLNPDYGTRYAEKYVKVRPGRIKRIAIEIPCYAIDRHIAYTLMPYYSMGRELYSFTTFEYFEPIRFCWHGPRTEPWVVIHIGPRVSYYHRPGHYRYYYDGFRPPMPVGPGMPPPMDPMHHTYGYHHNNGGYPATHDWNNKPEPKPNNDAPAPTATVRPKANGGSMSHGNANSGTSTGSVTNAPNNGGSSSSVRPSTPSGNGSNSGNGTSEQASGQNGDNNGGTEAIDDNDTPKTDGSGTETIDDNDTPKTDGDEADDGSDTMPSMLPIILIILAIIAAFLLLLFSRRKRDDEQ